MYGLIKSAPTVPIAIGMSGIFFVDRCCPILSKLYIFGFQMQVEIRVPVRSHVKRIVMNFHETEPVTLSLKSFDGIVLHSLLQRNLDRNAEKYSSVYPAEIRYTIPRLHYESFGCNLSNYSVHLFNTKVDAFFRNTLFSMLRFNERMGGHMNKKQFILTYLRSIGITEDDLPMDTLLRDYQRNRSGGVFGHAKLFSYQLSPKLTGPEYHRLKSIA